MYCARLPPCTFMHLLNETSQCDPTPHLTSQANWLRSVGVCRGDRVALYLPMRPELPLAMLACARIGAVGG